MDQHSFDNGLLTGLRAALVIIDRGEGRDGLAKLVAEIKETITVRENGGRPINVEMTEADILLPQPIAHPADFGLPSTGIDDERSALSFVRWNASAIEAASAGETRSGSTEGESAAPEGGDAQTAQAPTTGGANA